MVFKIGNLGKGMLTKWLITILAFTTAFNFGNEFVGHGIQMYILSGLVLYHLWVEMR